MASSRNIDINRVPKTKATKSANPGLDIKRKPTKTKSKYPKSKPKYQKKSLKNRPGQKKPGYFAIQAAAWRSVAVADIFQFALIRNLFSLRVLFFATLPIFIYQLRYLLVLKPEDILVGAKSSLGSENTSSIIAIGLVMITLIIISWLADSLITPAIMRYRYLQFDHRKALITRTLKESSAFILDNVWQKTIKTLVFVAIIFGLIVALYVCYILGYGSIQQQLVFMAIVVLIACILLVFYFALRFWLQAITAIGNGDNGSVIGLAFRQLFTHPITSFGYGLSWLIGLGIVTSISFLIVALVILGLDNTRVVSLNIILLAGSTTLLYIIWSVWTAWQDGYWTKLVHSRSSGMRLVLSYQDQLKYWHFLVLVIVILLIIAVYVVLAYVFSDQLNSILHNISAQLPHTLELKLPKPQ